MPILCRGRLRHTVPKCTEPERAVVRIDRRTCQSFPSGRCVAQRIQIIIAAGGSYTIKSDAGSATAGSEGSGLSSEKPPPQAEYRPGYLESMVFAPAAQGLALGQARPLSQLRCQLRCALRVCRPQAANILYTFQGSQWLVRIRPRFLHIGSAYRPSSTAEAVPLLQGEGYELPSGGIRSSVILSSERFPAAWQPPLHYP